MSRPSVDSCRSDQCSGARGTEVDIGCSTAAGSNAAAVAESETSAAAVCDADVCR